MTAPFTTFRFEVVLDLDQPTDGLESPLCDAAFAECDGLEMTMEPKIVESASVTDRQQRLIGPVKYGQVTLRRGMTGNLQLWQWFARGTRPGSVLTAHGEITMWDTDGTPAIRFSLEGCLPVKMRAPALRAADGLVAIEELGLVCEKITIDLADGGGLGLGVGVGISAGIGVSAGASLSVGGGVGAGISAGAGVSISGGAGLSIGGGL
jgi:phage tail-like protein